MVCKKFTQGVCMSQSEIISLAYKKDPELRILAEHLYVSDYEYRLKYFSSLENAERIFSDGVKVEDISTRSKIFSKLKLLKSLSNDLSSKRIRLNSGLDFNKISEANLQDFEHVAWRQEEYFSSTMGFNRKTSKGERLKSKFLADSYAVHSVAVEKGMHCALLTNTLREPVEKKFWFKGEGVQHILSGKESSEKLIKQWTGCKNKIIHKETFGIRFLDVDAKGNMHLHIVLFYYPEDEEWLENCFYKTMQANGAGKVEFKTRSEELVKDSNRAINYLAKKFDDNKWLAALSRSNAVTSRTYQLFGINLQTAFYNATLKNLNALQGVTKNLDALHSILSDKKAKASLKKYTFFKRVLEGVVTPVKVEKAGAGKELVGVLDKETGKTVLWKIPSEVENNIVKQEFIVESEEEVTERLQHQFEEHEKNTASNINSKNDEVNVSTINTRNKFFASKCKIPSACAANVETVLNLFVYFGLKQVGVISDWLHLVSFCTHRLIGFNFDCLHVMASCLLEFIRGPPLIIYFIP